MEPLIQKCRLLLSKSPPQNKTPTARLKTFMLNFREEQEGSMQPTHKYIDMLVRPCC